MSNIDNNVFNCDGGEVTRVLEAREQLRSGAQGEATQVLGADMCLRSGDGGEATRAFVTDMLLRNNDESEVTQAFDTNVSLLCRDIVPTRTYVDICRRATRELIRSGASEQEVVAHYEQTLLAWGNEGPKEFAVCE